MSNETDDAKVERFREALNQLLERLAEDRYVLAAVLVGQLCTETIWRRERLHLWIIEADGVTRRLRSDGNEERIFRLLVENGIAIHAEVIPRSRFKQMVEGSSRTAFSCNFFAHRELVFSKDASIDNWFDAANRVATKDQERELLMFSTWTIHAVRHARRLLTIKQDLDLAVQEVLHAAHSIAYTEIIRSGQIWEEEPILKALELSPQLFQQIYLDVLAKRRNKKTLDAAISAMEEYLTQHYAQHLKPLLSYLRKQDRLVALSEISDHFAYSQLYPWHLEAACEWLERQGHVEKFSAPFKLTKRSLEEVEEPAYAPV